MMSGMSGQAHVRRAVRVGLAMAGAMALIGPVRAGTLTVPTNYGSFQPITFNASYTPPRDVTVGSVIQQNQPVGINYGMRVSGVYCPIRKTVTINGSLVPGMTDTYQTNVPGIGVRFFTTAGWNGSWEQAPGSSTYYPPSSYAATAWYTSAALVVTGQVGSGRLTSLPSMTIALSGSCFPTVTRTQTIAAGSVIVPTTCTVTTPSIAVTLPNVKAGDFSGVGSTKGDTGLRIGLSCRAGADVNVTLTDATDPGNTSNLLTLASGSTARGVKLRVLYNGSPVAYGPDSAVAGNLNQWRVGPSSSVTSVPLTAQYIATDTVLPGIVKGIATFTMSYQ
ncbi:fimbrial protein [Burkholderia alba]|uniref:fimbrial protein n=1 Tax=Burkholderia alba TaxID=2683677 RepID=UPI002B054AD1|nr:fimbrial protein [Burkholderia alba]